MCGGFVTLYSHNSNNRVMPHVLYNVGRLITYLSLAIAGAYFGASLDRATELIRISALLAGLGLIGAGIIQAARISLPGTTRVSEAIGRCIGTATRAIFTTRSSLKPLLIGMTTTLLPCGWLYAFLALAVASADPGSAIVILFVFWLGTLPVMATFGFAGARLISKIGSRRPLITGILMVIGGLSSIMLHLLHALPGQSCNHSMHQHAVSNDTAPADLQPGD
jgi:sulfite exporter TauE/SafE